jgi:hypothetical protein
MISFLSPEMEKELNTIRAEQSESDGGMAQLFDPAGRPNIICRTSFAERWCSGKSDWTFEVLS